MPDAAARAVEAAAAGKGYAAIVKAAEKPEYWRKRRMRAIARARKRSKKLRKRKGPGWKVAEALLGGAYARTTT